MTIVPETGATTVTVVRPDGSRRPLATGSIATFGETDLLGVYTVEQTFSGRTDRSWFAINLFSDATSQLAPVDRLALPPARILPTAQTTHSGLIQVWPWIALVALGLVLAEWLAFHRGL